MEAIFKRCKNSLVVKLSGEIDADKAGKLRMKIDVEYDEQKLRDIVFDFTDVGFMDSSGIGMIIGRYKRVSALGGQVKIFGANNTVKRIIELSGLGKIVKIYNTEREAVGRGDAI